MGVEPKNAVPVALIAPCAGMAGIARKLEKQRCLLIADDLTGGADAGAQFAKRGLKTLLIPFRGEDAVPLAAQPAQDVLVLNTASRSLPPAEAFRMLSNLLKGFDPKRFPILYKKIDSTLRGNIGSEIDAILQETNLPLCFLAPSYPEQDRVLVGGIMMVGEKPLALTEAARDAASPVQESHVCKLLANQTSLSIGTIGLTQVASGKEALRSVVEREQRAGRRIIAFDAVSRGDLATIAEVALSMETVPLLAGSAGLAGEVARILVRGQVKIGPERQRTFRHILIIGGSASAVTHAQLQRLRDGGLPSFELPRDLVSGDGRAETEGRRQLARLLGSALAGGSVIFRTFAERWTGNGGGDAPIPQRITGVMAGVALEALQESGVGVGDLALILTGGDTALGVLQLLDYEGIELEGELLEGIVRGNLRGGPWDGLTIVTKAGAFGKEDALVRIVERLTRDSVEPLLEREKDTITPGQKS
ncbi:MAG: four-carbon acid sugar kinase family protein [Deltaproteobacteria bacterium]|nr:four-carbon acid sugar kinase family protein [Deltaproteobacteria bacterium]